jgi:ribosomal protein S12 methylthiotransferase accessory factor
MDPRLCDVIEWLVNSETSVIREINYVPLPLGMTNIYCAKCYVNNPGLIGDSSSLPKSYQSGGSGIGLSESDCLWAAIGETLERYCAGIYFDDQLVEMRYSDIGADDAINPGNLVTYGADQYADPEFPFAAFDPTIKRSWVRVRKICGDKESWAPAQLVFHGYDARDRSQRLVQSVSTGLACGTTLHAAIRGGLCEVLERDAFMLYWLAKISPPELTREEIELYAEASGIRHIVKSIQFDIRVLCLLAEHNIPTFLAFLSPKGRNIGVFGASCHPVTLRAFRKAVLESVHTWLWMRDIMAYGIKERSADDISLFKHHVCYYLQPENAERLSFLFNRGVACGAFRGSHEWPITGSLEREGNGADEVKNLKTAVDAVNSIGYPAYFFETTTADIFDLGFHTVRVIVPGLQPLYCGTKYLNYDDRRIRRFLGSNLARESVQMTGTFRINDDPHPFP